MQCDLYDISGKISGKVSLPQEIFGLEVKPQILAQSIRVYLSNQRQKGAAKTKSRGDVVGSTRKIYKQKGTGRARHGDKKAPIFVGGGKAHGPTGLQNYKLKMSKKMRSLAVRSTLSQKLKEKNIVVVEGMGKMTTKSKGMIELLFHLKMTDKKKKLMQTVLLIMPEKTDKVLLAARNINKLEYIYASRLNAYKLITARKIVLMKESIDLIKKAFGKNND